MVKKISCIDDNLNIFSIDDEKLKILAKVISNKSSIEILNLLFHNELTANEIAQKNNMSLQLVKYYLEKMLQIELIHVSKTRCLIAVPIIFDNSILPNILYKDYNVFHLQHNNQ